MLKESSIFKNYPSVAKKITNQFQQKQLEKKRIIEEMNKINQIYREINYSILYTVILVILPIVASISVKLYNTHNQSIKRINAQIKSYDESINQLKEELPLIYLNHIKEKDYNWVLSEKLLCGFRLKYGDLDQDGNSNGSSSNSILLKYENQINDIEKRINEKRSIELESYNGNLLLKGSQDAINNNNSNNSGTLQITNIDDEPSNSDSDNGDSIRNGDNRDSKQEPSNSTTGPINEDKENHNNDTIETPGDSNSPPSQSNLNSTPLLKSNSSSNLKLSIINNSTNKNKNTNNNNNSNDSSNSNQISNVELINYIVTLELKKELVVENTKWNHRKIDEADREKKEIEKEIEKKEQKQREKQAKLERSKREMQEEQDELKSTKFFSLLIRLMLVVNIIPELAKLFIHHLKSLLPTIHCISLNEFFKISTKELLSSSHYLSIFNPKYLIKLIVNHFILNIPTTIDNTGPGSIGGGYDIFDCLPTSIDINWKLWVLTFVYIALFISTLYFQINFFITSIIFITISISTYKINYNHINHYFPHIIINLLIVYSVKRFNQKIKQSEYSTLIRISITLLLILYNHLAFNYYLYSTHLFRVK